MPHKNNKMSDSVTDSQELTTIHGEPITITTTKDGFPSVEGMVIAKMMSVQTTLRFGNAWKNDADDMHKDGWKMVEIGKMMYVFAPK